LYMLGLLADVSRSVAS